MPAPTQPRDLRPAVLVIAATDSSGGAGLTRDVRVLTDFSVDALCVTTAVTAQSDNRVLAIHHVPPENIRAQLTAALETRRVGAIKIGMLGTRATVEAVAEGLARSSSISIVLDPVLVSSSGGTLLEAAGRTALLEKLLPQVTLLTPNVPEAAALLGDRVATTEAELIEQGRRLLNFGCEAILLKGGHATGEEAVDLLVIDSRRAYPRSRDLGKPADILVERITSSRESGTSRGTGCALASAIAASLTSGHSLAESCRRAKRYVLETMLTRQHRPKGT